MNSFDKEEQHIFLDIACFLIKENMDTYIKIWDQSCGKGSLGFQNLHNRCLVEIDGDIIQVM